MKEDHKQNLSKSWTPEKRARASALRKGKIPKNLLYLHKLPRTNEWKEKIRESNIGKKSPSGSKHWNWKGGVTPINHLRRNSTEYKLWRKAVFERDNYTCIWCGAKNGNGKRVILNADHIKPWVHFPELRFAIDNGRTLCRPCHETTFIFNGNQFGNI